MGGDGDLLSIGSFALLTGLPVPTLRHYDAIGLLVPEQVDPVTAYRRYHPEQVRTGRLLRALRAVDLPIEQCHALLAGADDPAHVHAVLTEHRERLHQRRADVEQMLVTVDRYLEGSLDMTAAKGTRVVEVNLGVADVDATRTFYESAFGETFTEDRHDDGPVHLQASFGTWPSDQFFLLNIHAGETRADFGFLVDDLDATHARAVAAGALESMAPHDASGMPRHSSLYDPGGNLVNLYQNVS